MTATLGPSPPELGGKICYGAEAGDFYWGVGRLTANAGGDDCCLEIPEAGTDHRRASGWCRDQAGRGRRAQGAGASETPEEPDRSTGQPPR